MNTSNESSRWGAVLIQLERQRLRWGWTRDELAIKAGISRTTLFNLERGGTQQPRLSTLKKLAESLEIDYQELIRNSLDAEDSDARKHGGHGVLSQQNSPSNDLVLSSSPTTQELAFDRETNPFVAQIVTESPELFQGFEEADWNELYSCMGMGGALSPSGVRDQANRILRKKNLIQKLEILLETHLSEVTAVLLETLFGQVQIQPSPGSQPTGWQPPFRQRPPGSSEGDCFP